MRGKRQSWHSLKHHRGICLEGLGETTKYLKQSDRFPLRNLNMKSSEHEAD
jgi:hypothetical protein